MFLCTEHGHVIWHIRALGLGCVCAQDRGAKPGVGRCPWCAESLILGSSGGGSLSKGQTHTNCSAIYNYGTTVLYTDGKDPRVGNGQMCLYPGVTHTVGSSTRGSEKAGNSPCALSRWLHQNGTWV